MNCKTEKRIYLFLNSLTGLTGLFIWVCINSGKITKKLYTDIINRVHVDDNQTH